MRHLSLWLIGVFAFAFFSTSAQAQQVYGELKVVKGDVSIKSGRDMKVTKAAIGMRVFPSDTIKTGKDSRAKILMVDKNEINISPESEIVLQKYVYDPAAGKKDVLLNVLTGKVRSKVEQKYDGTTTKFQVKTPSAVAGVRGTDFLTSFNSSTRQSQVVTFHGKVEFGQPGAGGAISNPVMVTPGQMSTAAAGAAPSAPVEMPKQQLASMDKESAADTATTSAPKNDNDSRQPTSEEKKKEDGAKSDGAKNEGAKNDGAKNDGAKNDGAKSDSAKNEGNNGDGGRSDTAKNSGNNGNGNGTGNNNGNSANNNSGSTTSGSDKSPGATTGGTTTAGTNASGSSATSGSGSAGAPPPPSMTGDRSPSSVGPAPLGPPVPTSGSIIKPGDIVGACTTCAPPPPPINILPPMPTVPITQPTANLPPPCDFCNSTIQNGNTKLLINIQTPNP